MNNFPKHLLKTYEERLVTNKSNLLLKNYLQKDFILQLQLFTSFSCNGEFKLNLKWEYK